MQRRALLSRAAEAALGFGILRYAGACRRPPTSNPRFVALRERYFRRSLELNPVTSTYLGGDGWDPALRDVSGRLRDYSASAIAAEVTFCREVERELRGFDPSRLATPERIDLSVMVGQVAYLIHQLEARRYHERCVDSYVAEPFRGVDWQIQQMTDAGGGLRGTAEEWDLVVSRVRAVPAYLDVARANLLAGKAAGNLPDRRMVELDGLRSSAANAEYFGTTLPGTARRLVGSRPFGASLLRRLAQAGAAAGDAWKRFGAFLRATFELAEHADRFAVGEREYSWRLANCLREERSPALLFDYGAEQVALYEDRIFGVAEEVARAANLGLSFGTPEERRSSVRAVMDHLSQDSPRSDEELFRWYREAGERAVAYGREHQLFDIPAEYRLDIVETPPALRSTIEAAYYPAPPFKRAGVGRFYLTPTGNDPAALRLNNRASVADTAVHEGFPGHDWHFKYMTQHATEISPVRWLTPGAVEDSFSMWEDSMAAEGWALYAEELMAEPLAGRPHGFYSAAEHLYELQGQLLRAVRVRVDVGIHTGRMTFDQAVDYLAEHVEFVPGACGRAASDPKARAICDGARRAIYRYSKWPTQAITYNLGKNAIVDLREAYRRRAGGSYSARTFHERFMGMGTIPAGYFRDEFLEG